MVRVNCPSCGALHELTDVYRGKRIRCNKCQTTIDVPTAAQPDSGTQPKPATTRPTAGAPAPHHHADPKRAGKPGLGVALSGGGFRAGFFHLGVLAQMARLGMLRHVEVLSTVSGGSVIGALYYLLVKGLLEEKEDAAVTDEDYRLLVARLESIFFKAVQQNLRVRSLLNPFTLIRTCMPNYSRTDHLGHLFDKFFYRPTVDRRRRKPVLMRELPIQPKGEPEGFRPLRHNAKRSAKVPILLLNATTLNTGHNWRFEAVRMGEPQPQSALHLEIGKELWLRRPHSYEDITPRQRDIELGLAVAASCCVPGLFPPLALSRLYDRGIRVQLVDGAVHDNQGINGLLDLECGQFVISDGSEQLHAAIDPPVQLLPVLARSTDVLGNQVREETMLRLMQGDHRPVALLHLRRGLSAKAVAWLDRNGRPAAEVKTEPPARKTFDVPEETQEALARIRTDLDSFTEVEAYSLMLDAYLMSAAELGKVHKSAAGAAAAEEACPWRFLQVGPWFRQPTPRYRRRLQVARERHFKLWRLKWPFTLLLILILLAGLGWLAHRAEVWTMLPDWLAQPVPLGVLLGLFVTLGLVVLPQLINVDRFPSWLRTPVETLGRFVLRLVLAPLITTVSAFQLYVIDPLYQWEGRLKRLGRPPGEAAGLGQRVVESR
jgi:NTE family protein